MGGGGGGICLSSPIFHWSEYCRQACILYAAASVYASNMPSSRMLHLQTAFVNIEWRRGGEWLQLCCISAQHLGNICFAAAFDWLFCQFSSPSIFISSESSVTPKGSVPTEYAHWSCRKFRCIQKHDSSRMLCSIIQQNYIYFATCLLKKNVCLSVFISRVFQCVCVYILYVLFCLWIKKKFFFQMLWHGTWYTPQKS